MAAARRWDSPCRPPPVPSLAIHRPLPQFRITERGLAPRPPCPDLSHLATNMPRFLNSCRSLTISASNESTSDDSITPTWRPPSSSQARALWKLRNSSVASFPAMAKITLPPGCSRHEDTSITCGGRVVATRLFSQRQSPHPDPDPCSHGGSAWNVVHLSERTRRSLPSSNPQHHLADPRTHLAVHNDPGIVNRGVLGHLIPRDRAKSTSISRRPNRGVRTASHGASSAVCKCGPVALRHPGLPNPTEMFRLRTTDGSTVSVTRRLTVSRLSRFEHHIRWRTLVKLSHIPPHRRLEATAGPTWEP